MADSDWVNVRDVVVAGDGPHDGRWYFESGPGSWAVLRASAEAMAPTRVTRDPVLDYELTQELRPHPTEDAVGKILRYRPRHSSLKEQRHG